MRLPEYACPHCARSVTLIPGGPDAPDLSRCSTCGGAVVLLPDGELAIPLPRGMAVSASREVVEVAIEAHFVTLGLADSALRYRVVRDEVVWSRPPLLIHARLTASWVSLPRSPLRSFDWRFFERGIRGTNTHEAWYDVVFQAHDTSERASGHRLPEALDGALVTTILQRAHEDGVARGDMGGSAYRTAPTIRRPPLLLLEPSGRLLRVGTP